MPMNPMMSMMQNNPIMQLVQLAKSGGNPMAVIQMAAQKNPQMAQFVNMVNGKSPDELRKIAENMCKERGTDINEMAKSLGIDLPN